MVDIRQPEESLQARYKPRLAEATSLFSAKAHARNSNGHVQYLQYSTVLYASDRLHTLALGSYYSYK